MLVASQLLPHVFDWPGQDDLDLIIDEELRPDTQQIIRLPCTHDLITNLDTIFYEEDDVTAEIS